MAERSAIEWCDATVNFWWGCTKVSPGCDNCYAEEWNEFRGTGEWGAGAPRRKIAGAVGLIRKLQRDAAAFFAEHGRRRRVFMQSMSDTFDNEVDPSLRAEALCEAEAANELSIILLTKRGTNVAKMVPGHWIGGGWPKHIGLMFSITNQREADRDIPRLLRLKAELGIPWVGISMEPMLAPINVRRLPVAKYITVDALTGFHCATRTAKSFLAATKLKMPDLPSGLPSLDWIIVGGESGHNARPLHPGWVRPIQRACLLTGTAFLFKQWGQWMPESDGPSDLVRSLRARRGAGRPETMELHRDPSPFATVQLDIMTMFKVGKKRSGRLLDGVEHLNFPEALR